jgi:hypothetical protein
MKRSIVALLLFSIILLSGCANEAAPSCQWATGTPRYMTIPPEELPTPGPAASPIQMEINGRNILVDKVIEGPLCNDSWSGIVYVTCNIQVYPWTEQPTFLKNCNLAITPDAVVYVAYHNDTAYYKGCSCHTGEITGP